MDIFDRANLGNSKIIEQLERLARKSRLEKLDLAASFIFCGLPQTGKRAAVLYFAAALFCQSSRSGQPCGKCAACRQVAGESYADLVWLERKEDKRVIEIDDVRDFIGKMGLSTTEGLYRFGVIVDAERLHGPSANALLKTLEEPSRRSLTVLLANELESLPRTILSRSQVFYFYPPSVVQLTDRLLARGVKRNDVREVVALSAARPRLADFYLANPSSLLTKKAQAECLLKAVDTEINDRLASMSTIWSDKKGVSAVEQAGDILSAWQSLIRDWLLVLGGAGELVSHSFWSVELDKTAQRLGRKSVLAAAQAIQKGFDQLAANVNPKLVVENIIINL